MEAWTIPPIQTRLKHLWAFTAFTIPLSVKLYLPGIGTEVIFPAEPLIALLFLLQAYLLLSDRRKVQLQWKAMRHPMILLALAWLAIHAIATIFSAMPLVSTKALFVQVVYVSTFILFPYCFGRTGLLWIDNAWRLHDRGFLLIVFFALTSQSLSGFDRAGSHFSAFPFYNDHTIFSAALTFVLIRRAIIVVHGFREHAHISRNIFHLLILAGLFIAVILGFSRAAWLAVAITSLAALLFMWGLSSRQAIIAGLTVISLIAVFHKPLYDRLNRNTVVSEAYGTGLRETVLSIGNISTDASNVERIVRWTSAIRLFRESMITGHGPGTYQFLHFDKLDATERARLPGARIVADDELVPAWSWKRSMVIRDNANRSPSTGGTAHSEFLLGLAENGIAAGLWWIALVVVIIHAAAKTFSRNAVRPVAAQVAVLVLIAYILHAAVNNYLDDCKIAMLFWFAIGGLSSRNFEINAQVGDRVP